MDKYAVDPKGDEFEKKAKKLSEKKGIPIEDAREKIDNKKSKRSKKWFCQLIIMLMRAFFLS